jgi:mannose-1-phosphate guanylyltransferase/mannose-6-phosphate isomerase
MEQTRHAAVGPLDCGWSDVGAWSALWELADRDTDGNAALGDVVSVDTRNSYVRSTHRLVATVGVEDLVIVETPDAVLVANRAGTQSVKTIVEQLIADHREEADLHREVHRPWGAYDCIDSGDRFQVKRITVNPGAQISLQKHYHRAEHWVVVRGTAEVTCDDRVITLTENESTFIPLGAVHRLRNPGKMPLEIVEVQSGSYLGEDDIERFEDVYGRSEP